MKLLCVLFVIIFLYFLQGKIYASRCFNKVTTDIKFKNNGVFEGEVTELKEKIYNKKILPLWWLTAKYKISRNIEFQEKKNINQGNDNYRQDFFSIGAYEKVNKTFKIVGAKRGYYTIDEVELHSGDLFGLYKLMATFECNANIHVYPKLIEKNELRFNFNSLNGEILAKRNIMEDPFQLRGIREYQPFDTMKMVNWSASAKTGELKVNEYDFTASQEIIIFLNVEKYNAWDKDILVEKGISLAASMVTELIEQGMKVGLCSNGVDMLTGEKITILPSAGVNQNIRFYESLARLDVKNVSEQLSETIQREAMKTSNNKIFIIISHYIGESLKAQVSVLRRKSNLIKWIVPIEKYSEVKLDENKDNILWEVKEA